MAKHCAARKRRKHIAIEKSAIIFSDAIHDKNYKNAADIAFLTSMEVIGFKGIMGAIEKANSYLRRKKKRKGLSIS